MTFVDGPVRATVPATSANLGPGFDTLGLALDLRDTLEAEVLPEGLVVEVEGYGAGQVPLDERHLVVRAMRATFERLGQSPAGLRLSCTNVIPHARGLGSSSAAIVGGVWLARELVAGGRLLLDDGALLDLAAQLEGHPDNVAPALLGGFVISGQDADGSFWAVPGSVDPRVGAVVFVPPTPVSTEAARGLLPADVPHADAAANAGRAALLVAALSGRPEQLLRATEDRLHQEYRRPAMPESLALVEALRADGVPAVVSGAGPTVLAFADGPGTTSAAALLARCPEGWQAHALAVTGTGAALSDLP
ncbi:MULTISPECIES: homoserine kinase [unclassified Nocardioides]|jgi:homoserine kinase|uniref:homoserine kinase n=1 Tax=unclassified Nocardioides TaxID=2615069 RepID=UPI0007032057|nr:MULTISPECIES: homoserine kinase [unclassified Nocardioides]KRC56842.1 homoserine kinase [Nocardioides sp. Root79]KRC77051.1 homoserine kinase [Nocardioides sp. Root240]